MAPGRRTADVELIVVANVPGHYALGTVRNILIVYWMNEATRESVQRINDTAERMLVRYPRGFSALHIIKDGATLPEADVRKDLTRSLQRFSSKLACFAVVLPGQGFWASALQSIITGIRMLAPMGDMSFRIVADASKLEKWYMARHLEQTGEQISDELLLRHIEELLRLANQPAPP